MLRFHIAILPPTDAKQPKWAAAFDTSFASLQQFERLFIEPDGSFVWTGALPDGTTWQVDGNLIDQGERLAYVELKGCCPEAQFDQFLATLGWPEVPLKFELTRRGVVVDESEFRKLAAAQDGPA